MSKDKKQTGDALELIVLRNQFYNDHYKSSFYCFLIVLTVNVLLLLSILHVLSHPPRPEYFPATNDYHLIELHPLSDPTVSDKVVMQWASLAAQRAYNLDYVHWQSELQDASADFTDSGWSNFIDSMKNSNNLKSITDLKLVSSAKITGAPEITNEAVVDGRYAWKLHVPMEVTFQGKKSITQTMMLTLIVIRAHVSQYPDRIAINNYIADIRG